MAVQAHQYAPPHAVPLEEHHHHRPIGFGACNASDPISGRYSVGIGGGPVHGAAAFSGPESELTCNASGSRKRHRIDGGGFGMKSATAATGLQLLSSGDQHRMMGSTATSTSGRSATVSPLAQELVSHLYHQSLEIDALVRLQGESLRSGVEEARKRHCRVVLAAIEERVARKMKEKEAEIETARRRNADLEEKVRQLVAENQIWFNVARNNEAVVSSLRSSLEQALVQSAAGVAPAREGVGDSDGGPFPADDAESCCVGIGGQEEAAAAERENREPTRRRGCRICADKEACVLLLPCRHLCLCGVCEPKVDTCPACRSSKNGSLHVFLS